MLPIDIYLLDDIQSDSEDLLITEYLSSHLLHGFIDFLFIHGGEGTVQTACESGKPFIGVGMQFEQRSCNIDYCVKYGNAIALTQTRVTEKLQIALREVSSPKVVSRHAHAANPFSNKWSTTSNSKKSKPSEQPHQYSFKVEKLFNRDSSVISLFGGPDGENTKKVISGLKS